MSALPLSDHQHRSTLGSQPSAVIRAKLARAMCEWEDAMMDYDALNAGLRSRHADAGRQTVLRRDMPVFKDTLDAFNLATVKVQVYEAALRQAEARERVAAASRLRPRRTMPDNGAGYEGRRAS